LARLPAEINPHGAIQQNLFDESVATAWNIRRVRRAAAELCTDASNHCSSAAWRPLRKALPSYPDC
jgi:hypothetical protein